MANEMQTMCRPSYLSTSASVTDRLLQEASQFNSNPRACVEKEDDFVARPNVGGGICERAVPFAL